MPLMDAAGTNGERPVSPCVFRGEESLLTVPADWPRHTLVIYPFDRTDKTPIVKFAMEDLLRQALGTGPCDLDWWRQMVK